MNPSPGFTNEDTLAETRLFVEEICCDLLRFLHAADGRVDPQRVRIIQEYSLGAPGAYADIRVQPEGAPPYYLEVKYGYSPARTMKSLTRKYSPTAAIGDASKLIVVADGSLAASWPAIESQVRSGVARQLELELWDEQHLLGMFKDAFGVHVESLLETDVLEVRTAVEGAKGRHAFEEDWVDDLLQNSLLWHYGFWRLKQLRRDNGLTPRTIMPPGTYHGVVTLMADLSGFSGYVKDTRDDAIVRQSLTTFYSKARNEILNTGGMLYQFVGDEVIGLFGLPRPWDGYLESAMDCARGLADIGNSVSHEWQRHLDNIQLARGVHIGACLGSMQVVSLRPFSRSHVSGIGQVINLASRLMAEAGPSQIVVSNTYYQALPTDCQGAFEELPAIDAKNMGRIKAWRKGLTTPREAAVAGVGG